jgi:hypothetical protein
MKLEVLDAAEVFQDLRIPPSNGHHKPSRATTILARNTAELYKDKHNHTVLPFSKTFS